VQGGRDLRGAYAIGVVALADPDMMTGRAWAARSWWASARARISSPPTSPALIAETRRVIYLEDGDVVALARAGVRVVDRDGNEVHRRCTSPS